MHNRDEVLDMAVHALAPMMKARQQANPEELFDEAIEVGKKLVDKVDQTAAANPNGPSREEIMDMGIHALSALLNGRPGAKADDLLDECMAVAQALIARVDQAISSGEAKSGREEVMDVAVHVQTAILSSRPQVDPVQLSDQCVSVGEKLVAKIDA